MNKKFNSKDFEGALILFEKVLQIQPIAPNTNFMIASIYSIQKNKDKAFNHLVKAVEQGFSDFQKIQSLNCRVGNCRNPGILFLYRL